LLSPQSSPLFAYTTLFRSERGLERDRRSQIGRRLRVPLTERRGDVVGRPIPTATECEQCASARRPHPIPSVEPQLRLRTDLEERSEEHTSELQSRVELVCR